MRRRVSSHALLISALLTFFFSVQTPASAQQLRFDRLGLDEGLSQVTPNALLQDRRGFLWIGTQEGLNRWDGYEMLVLKNDPSDPNSPAGNFILDLHEDRDGGIWIFYQEAGLLDRYDPSSEKFLHLKADPSDPTGLAVAQFTPGFFVQDESGSIWTTQQNVRGIVKVDPSTGRFRHVRHDPENPASLPQGQVFTAYRDRTGILWLGTPQGPVRRTTDQATEPGATQETFHRYSAEDGAPTAPTSKFYEDADDVLWVATWGRGLFFYDREADRFVRPPQADVDDAAAHSNFIPPSPGGSIPTFAEDREGGLWVVLRSGVRRWNQQRTEAVDFRNDPADPGSLSTNTVNLIYADRTGDVWIGTGGGGLEVWDPQTESFLHHLRDPADPKSIGSNTVASILEDRSGLLWIGAPPNGLSRFSRQEHQFRTYRLPTTAPPGKRENLAFSVLEDRRGRIWMGTVESGLYLLDARRANVVERYAALPGDPRRNVGSNFIRSIFELPDGRLLVSAFGAGLAEIDPDQSRVLQVHTANPSRPGTLSNNFVWGIDADREGNVWISTAGGWNRFDPENGTFQNYLFNPNSLGSLASPFSRVTYEDRLGRLWLAGNGLQLFKRDTETFQSYFHNPQDPTSLSNDNVMVLWDDGDGTLWIGTYGGGVNRFDPSTGVFEHIRRDDGLPSDSVYSLLPDDEGFLWIATNNGLARFDRVSETFQYYDRGDGLPSNEFNGRAWMRTRDGEFLFGTIEGLVGFYPEDIRPSDFEPPVVLTAFRKFDRRVRFGKALDELEKIELSYKDRFFSFEFAALDLTAPNKNRYAYKLEGFDDDWIESGSRRFASYTNLDGGQYTFRVKGSNPDGVWNQDGASIDIVVIPPPWKTWWAYSLYGLGFILCVGGYARFKTLRHREEVASHREESERQRLLAERLRQIDQMKDEFLANTSHELRTPLNGIIGLAESMLDGASGVLSENARENLFMVASSGRRLAHLVDDILDFSKLKNHQIELRRRPIGIKELVDIVLTLSAPLVVDKDLKLINAVPDDLPPVDGDENRLQQVLHNLIGNAVKFTTEGEVTVSARRQGYMLAVTVADTGIGIAPDQLDKVFQSFEQADASTAREYGGTGLGLTITRQLIELHGGEIRASSEVGKGTQMIFTLPLRLGAVADQGTSQNLARIKDHSSPDFRAVLASHSLLDNLPPISSSAPTESASAEAPEQASGRALGSDSIALVGTSEVSGEVLIVDDEPVNLRVLENFLGLAGYAVRSANDGLQALQEIDEQTPDLVLLDVMMPRMTGFEVTRRIRRRYSANALPIVLLTAKNQVSDLMEGLDSGANDYLTKPFSKNELMARIRTHLGLSRAHRREAENQRRVEELEQARAIQLSMLPKQAPENETLEIAAYMQTASEVGGDYYDFFPQEDGSLFMVVGDATGHGISAGMMVSMTKSALRALEVQSPHVLLHQLNSVMKAVHLERMQMALNVLHFTQTGPDRSEVAYSSAAMPPAYLYSAETGEVEEILLPGLPLGGLAESKYGLRVFEFRRGDVLVLLSDGLTEVLDETGRQLGVDAIRDEIAAQAGIMTPQELIDHLVAVGTDFANAPPDDDITLAVVRRR